MFPDVRYGYSLMGATAMSDARLLKMVEKNRPRPLIAAKAGRNRIGKNLPHMLQRPEPC